MLIDGLQCGHFTRETFEECRRGNITCITITAGFWEGTLESLDALARWRDLIKENDDLVLLATRAEDVEEAARTGKTAIIIGYQNSNLLEGRIRYVEFFAELGVRVVQLTYNNQNELAGSCYEAEDSGLARFGREVIDEMNRCGILVDLSHVGNRSTLEAILHSKKPVAITHTICEALRRNHPRAKTDAQIRACAEKGGVVGIAALGYFLGPDPGGDTTIEAYADHIEHAAAVAGHEHIALASDFPPQGIASWATRENWYEPRLKSFEPSYEVRWPPWIPELDVPERFLNVTRVLERRGWTASRLELLLGRNWLRLFRDTIG